MTHTPAGYEYKVEEYAYESDPGELASRMQEEHDRQGWEVVATTTCGTQVIRSYDEFEPSRTVPVILVSYRRPRR